MAPPTPDWWYAEGLVNPTFTDTVFTYSGNYQVDRIALSVLFRPPPWQAANTFPNNLDYFLLGVQSVASGGTPLDMNPTNFPNAAWAWAGCPRVSAQSESAMTYVSGANQEFVLYRGWAFSEVIEAPMSFASGSKLSVSFWWSAYPYWQSAVGTVFISGRTTPVAT